ncbi:MAG: fluoride efflux transporter CrcB [Verrucomicrobia bacterium]|nr:fluoride efflux transporter CrcB [Verrucomicrobiota bacterium]MDA1066785.1 fluoride efflux transporter CrcB [Verrucomicrobiota bacterium]
MSLIGLFWIGLGGAIGSILRALFAISIKSDFPWATLLANVSGCLIIGLVIGHESITADWAEHSRGFVVIGFCGGFTTFSTFSLQTFKQLEGGNFLGAFSNILLSFVVCLLAVWAGIKLAKLIFHSV